MRLEDAVLKAVVMGAAKFEKEITTHNQFLRNWVGVGVDGWCISDFDSQMNRSGYLAWLRQNGFSYVPCADYIFVHLGKPKTEARRINISLPLWTSEQKRSAGMLQRLVIEYDTETTVRAWIEAGERAHAPYRRQLTVALSFRNYKDENEDEEGLDSGHAQAIVHSLIEHDRIQHIQRGY